MDQTVESRLNKIEEHLRSIVELLEPILTKEGSTPEQRKEDAIELLKIPKWGVVALGLDCSTFILSTLFPSFALSH